MNHADLARKYARQAVAADDGPQTLALAAIAHALLALAEVTENTREEPWT